MLPTKGDLCSIPSVLGPARNRMICSHVEGTSSIQSIAAGPHALFGEPAVQMESTARMMLHVWRFLYAAYDGI